MERERERKGETDFGNNFTSFVRFVLLNCNQRVNTNHGGKMSTGIFLPFVLSSVICSSSSTYLIHEVRTVVMSDWLRVPNHT